jgi:hypothetical protein
VNGAEGDFLPGFVSTFATEKCAFFASSRILITSPFLVNFFNNAAGNISLPYEK